MKTLYLLVSLLNGALSLTIPPLLSALDDLEADLSPRQSTEAACENTATSRSCWGNYSIDTNYYDVIPDTGVTREYWLTVDEVECAPDGYTTTCQAFNGTIPGPTIIADWGDTLTVHVTNNLPNNGTTIHWHGVRQLNSVSEDGVPGVTQCPIAPGEQLTYSFRVTQYGSSWYHSHFTLQYGQGVYGGLIFNGPATANYDEDLGTLILSDWHHESIYSLWFVSRQGAPAMLDSGLINGTNIYDCDASGDSTCTGVLGQKYETVFESGKTYLIRLVNVATDGHFQFSIDGHSLTVIATDFVPIVPYTTDSVSLSIAQRIDVLVEANADVGDYWIRGGWVTACSNINNPSNITGILRYDSSSTADPTSTSTVTASTSCGDEPYESIVPYLSLDVESSFESVVAEELASTIGTYFMWTINGSSLYLDWASPTLYQIANGDTVFPTSYNAVPVDSPTNGTGNTSTAEWALLVIQDASGFGITHPVHLHGHDFWVLAQKSGTYDPATAVFNLQNPPRRDTAALPGNGYLAIAFQLDNPGTWLVHCHIAWHASEGFSLEFVETESEIVARSLLTSQVETVTDTCDAWSSYITTDSYGGQDDSGI